MCPLGELWGQRNVTPQSGGCWYFITLHMSPRTAEYNLVFAVAVSCSTQPSVCRQNVFPGGGCVPRLRDSTDLRQRHGAAPAAPATSSPAVTLASDHPGWEEAASLERGEPSLNSKSLSGCGVGCRPRDGGCCSSSSSFLSSPT